MNIAYSSDEGGPSTLIESADPEILAEAEAAAAAAEQGEDVPAEEAPSGGEADVEEEPEDDYNAAWEVIDVARTIYLRIIEDAEKKQGGKGKGKASEAGEGGGNDEIKQAQLMLAECYETLGDISCETGEYSSIFLLQGVTVAEINREIRTSRIRLYIFS